MTRILTAVLIVLVAVGAAFAAGDFNKPTLTSSYSDFINEIHAIVNDVSKWLDNTGTTNTPAGAKRWNASTARFERYSSTTWVPLASKYAINADTLDGFHASDTAPANSPGIIPVIRPDGYLSAKAGSAGNCDYLAGYSANVYPAAAAIPVTDTFKRINLDGGKLSIGPGNYTGTEWLNNTLTLGTEMQIAGGGRVILGSNLRHNALGWYLVNAGGGALLSLDETQGQLMFSAATAGTAGSKPWLFWKKVWHEGNMGAGSGMDADSVDGLHAADFRLTTQKVSGDTVQRLNTQVGTYSTSTALIPRDNTVPQITEGTQLMSLAVTPTLATNNLSVEATVMAAANGANNVICALYRSDSASAIATVMSTQGGSDWAQTIPIKWTGVANSTASLTFSVRCGLNSSGTMSFNGVPSTGALFGGTAASTLQISEVQN